LYGVGLFAGVKVVHFALPDSFALNRRAFPRCGTARPPASSRLGG
jgi:hypothetical protein